MSVAAALLLAGLATSSSQPIAHIKFKHGRHWYHMVQADMASGVLTAKTVHEPRLTSIWTMIDKQQPVAAVTGTFFGIESQTPVADVLVDGTLVSRGSRGSVVGVSTTGGVEIFDKKYKEDFDWAGYQYGLRGAVRVVNAGEVAPYPKAQRFRDPRIWSRATRTGIGITAAGKLCLFATHHAVTLSELGSAMKARGVTNGVSLDGGSSTSLYYDGSLLISPKRKLSNLFVITYKPEYLAAHRTR